MKRVMLLLLMLLTVVAPAYSQFSNTIYQNLGSNIAITGIPGTVITSITIGTTSTVYHFTPPPPDPLLIGEDVILKNITGAGCTGLNATVKIVAFTANSFTTSQNSSGCTVATTGTFSVFLRNIGQTQHNLLVIFSNAPAMTCTTPAASLFILGSLDGTNFFSVQALANSGSGLIATLTAVGTYPFMVADLAAFDTTNCRAQVFYAGVLFPAPNIPDPAGVVIGNGTISFLQSCTNSVATAFSMGIAQAVALSGTTSIRVCHYDFSVSGATNFKLVYGTGANCGTGTTDLTGLYTAVTQLSVDLSLSPLTVPAGKALCISSSAAVTGGGIITFAQY